MKLQATEYIQIGYEAFSYIFFWKEVMSEVVNLTPVAS